MTIWRIRERDDSFVECPQCQKVFMTVFGLEKHLNVMHLCPDPPQMWRVRWEPETGWQAEQRDNPEYVIQETPS
jgi:hypothetical protein